MHFVVLLVLFVSLNDKNPHGKSVIVKGNNNVVSLGQNKGTDTAFSQILKKLESLDEKVSFLASHSASKLLHYFYPAFRQCNMSSV